MRVSAGGAKAESLTTKDKPASDGALRYTAWRRQDEDIIVRTTHKTHLWGR
jgi:hypothetical protein